MKQEQIDQLSVGERVKAPTPTFFQKIKIAGIVLATISAALLAAPVALPAIVTTIASYLAVAGTVATAISQVTVAS